MLFLLILFVIGFVIVAGMLIGGASSGGPSRRRRSHDEAHVPFHSTDMSATSLTTDLSEEPPRRATDHAVQAHMAAIHHTQAEASSHSSPSHHHHDQSCDGPDAGCTAGGDTSSNADSGSPSSSSSD